MSAESLKASGAWLQVASEHPYPEGLKDKMRKEYPDIKPMVIKGECYG